MEIMGIRPDYPVDGRSLTPVLDVESKRPESEPDRPMLYQAAWKARCVARSIVSGQHKLIDIQSNYEGLQNVSRLYDIGADPGEMTDLASQKPNVVTQLQKELEDRFNHYESLALSKPLNVLQEMDQDKLKALGYVDSQ